LEIVRQAIQRGHAVTALVRSSDGLKQFADRITVCRGDLLNSTDLEDAIQGHDAVLSAFGPRATRQPQKYTHRFRLPVLIRERA